MLAVLVLIACARKAEPPPAEPVPAPPLASRAPTAAAPNCFTTIDYEAVIRTGITPAVEKQITDCALDGGVQVVSKAELDAILGRLKPESGDGGRPALTNAQRVVFAYRAPVLLSIALRPAELVRVCTVVRGHGDDPAYEPSEFPDDRPRFDERCLEVIRRTRQNREVSLALTIEPDGSLVDFQVTPGAVPAQKAEEDQAWSCLLSGFQPRALRLLARCLDANGGMLPRPLAAE
jgi:hypothetical protein